MTGKFIGFTNRDTGATEYVALDRIVRVCPCQHPDHAGYALIILDLVEQPNHDAPRAAMVIEATMQVDEFMQYLQIAMEA